MRKSLKVAGIAAAVAAVVIAIALAKHADVARADRKAAADRQDARAADLALAQSQNSVKYPLTEIPEPKRAIAPKQVGSQEVTHAKASVANGIDPVEAKLGSLPRTHIIEAGAAPTLAMPMVPVLAQPAPRAVTSGPNRDAIVGDRNRPQYGPRTSGQGGAIGGDATVGINGRTGVPMGLPSGAVIRGGAVDGDHCDPRSAPRGMRPPS